MQANFKPKIIGFLCNWCSYAGADMAGVSRIQYPPNLRIVRVMCSGRVDPMIVLEAFLRGIDGVLVFGCHPGDCHYTVGNYYAERKIKLTGKMLATAGIDVERLYLDWISAAEGERFANIVEKFTQKVQELGPLGEKEGLKEDKLTERLSAIRNSLASDKLRWLVGKELQLVEEGNVYGEEVSQEELNEVIEENIEKEYAKNRILLLIEKDALSVKEIAKELNLCPTDVLRYVSSMENQGLVLLADIEDRTPKYVAA